MNNQFQRGDRIVVAYKEVNHRLKVSIQGRHGYIVSLLNGFDGTHMVRLDDGTLTYISPEDLKEED